MNFDDDFGTDLYIDDVDEAYEVAYGDGSNTPSDEAYGELMMEERPDQDGINDAVYNKHIGAEVIMDMPV